MKKIEQTKYHIKIILNDILIYFNNLTIPNAENFLRLIVILWKIPHQK